MIQHKTLFKEKLEKDKVIKIFSTLLDKVTPEEIFCLDDDELTKRVERVMVREAVAGTLNDLTPEEIEKAIALYHCQQHGGKIRLTSRAVCKG